MAFNGSGTFVRLYNWVNDRDAAIPITASRMDGEQDGFATGLSTCITKDGQTTVTANLPMNTFKHTGVGNANARDQYAAAGQIQDNSLKYAVGAGTANAQTVTLAPAITAYTDGMVIFFEAGATNTGATTLNVNSVGAQSVVMPNGDALPAGALTSGKQYAVINDATNTRFVLVAGRAIETGINIITVATTTDPVSITADTVTTGDAINVSADGLTSGAALFISSTSADATSRSMVNFQALGSDSCKCLNLSQSGNNNALSISSANTTTFGVSIVCDSVTTGGALSVSSNSASGSVRALVTFINDNSAAGGTIVLDLDQDADGQCIRIITAAQTANSIDITASSLTTGAAIRAYSNAPSTSGRNVVEIINDNSAATSANALHIQQDSSADAISIAHNGNGLALDIDGTNSSVDVMQVTANSLTTASLASFSSNSSSTGTRNLVEVINDNAAAANADCLYIQQDADAFAVYIDHNGNGGGVLIDSSATTAIGMQVTASSLTTGRAGYFYSNSADTNNRQLVRIENDNASASNALSLIIFQDGTSAPALRASAGNASFTSSVIDASADRTASTAFSLVRLYSNAFGDTEFNFRGDGNGFCDGSFTGGGADYAEYFEWEDGNPGSEDRRGMSVCLVGNKIVLAHTPGDPIEIIGVVSANPTVVGDAEWNKWKDKYLRDDLGSYIFEDYEVVEWVTLNEQGEETTETAALETVATLPKDAKITVQQRRKLNPEWDPNREYVPREQRKEWSPIGLMGKLRLRKGQPVNPNWIKLRDISENVEEWLIK